jgi:hypothetical protein
MFPVLMKGILGILLPPIWFSPILAAFLRDWADGLWKRAAACRPIIKDSPKYWLVRPKLKGIMLKSRDKPTASKVGQMAKPSMRYRGRKR